MLLSISHAGRAWFAAVAGRAEAPSPLPGLTIARAPSGPDRMVVTSIRSGSEAARKGLMVGDMVLDVNGRPIFTLDQARHYRQEGAAVRLRVSHRGRPRDVQLGRDGARRR